MRSGSVAAFVGWWSATIVLAIVFLAGTAYEWQTLIYEHSLTISRNLFGTTYYTLVGFHAVHVTVGVIVMLTVLGLVLRTGGGWWVAGGGKKPNGPATRHLTPVTQLVSWYWHFVDGVWVVVFTVVYLVGR